MLNNADSIKTKGLSPKVLVITGLLLASPAFAWAVPGDLNGSGAVDVTDVQCSILSVQVELLGEGEQPDCLFGEPYMADQNCSWGVNVTDVVLIIQLALGLELSPEIDEDGDGCPDACAGMPQCNGLPISEFFAQDCTQSNAPGDLRCNGDASGMQIMACEASGEWTLYDECGDIAFEYCQDLPAENGLLMAECKCYLPDCSHCEPGAQICWVNDAAESIIATCADDGTAWEESENCGEGALCATTGDGEKLCQPVDLDSVDPQSAADAFAAADFSDLEPIETTNTPAPVPSFSSSTAPPSGAEGGACDGGPPTCLWTYDLQVDVVGFFLNYVEYQWTFTRTGPQGEGNIKSPCSYHFEGYGIGGGLNTPLSFKGTFENVEASCTWPMKDNTKVGAAIEILAAKIKGVGGLPPVGIDANFAAFTGLQGTPSGGVLSGKFHAVTAKVWNVPEASIGNGSLTVYTGSLPLPEVPLQAVATVGHINYVPSKSDDKQCGVKPDPNSCTVDDGTCGAARSCQPISQNLCRCRCDGSGACLTIPERHITCTDAPMQAQLLDVEDSTTETEFCNEPFEVCVEEQGCQEKPCGSQWGLCCAPPNYYPDGCEGALRCCVGWTSVPGTADPEEPARCNTCMTGGMGSASEAEAACKCCSNTSYIADNGDRHCGEDECGASGQACCTLKPAPCESGLSCCQSWSADPEEDTCEVCLEDGTVMGSADAVGEAEAGCKCCSATSHIQIETGERVCGDPPCGLLEGACCPSDPKCDDAASRCCKWKAGSGKTSCDACLPDGHVLTSEDVAAGDANTHCKCCSGQYNGQPNNQAMCGKDCKVEWLWGCGNEDTDCDGLIGCDDPDCLYQDQCKENLHCDDGVDNDKDGLTDCADTDECAGANCDDNDACTEKDTCTQNGACEGVPMDCDDGDFCNGIEVCDPEEGDCQFLEYPACDDGLPCTTDYCNSAVNGCDSVPTDCDDDDFCNGVEVCVPAAGGCQSSPSPDCDDGVPCTIDSCDHSYGCIHTSKVCFLGSCNPSTGECAFFGNCGPNGSCDDGNPCTYDECDSIFAGCTNSLILCKDDGDPCTAESCHPTQGCISTPIVGCPGGP